MSTERRIIISGEDGGFSDLIEQLRELGTGMFEQLTNKADQYLERLTEITEQHSKMGGGSGGGGGDAPTPFGTPADRSGAAADFQRIFDIMSQGFASAAHGGAQLMQTMGYSQNVLGDIATLAARTANVPLGWIPFYEEFQEEALNAAADLLSVFTGAGQPYRQSLAEQRRMTGLSGSAFSPIFGMDAMESANYAGRGIRAMGTNRMPGGLDAQQEMTRLLATEFGTGMQRGEIFQFANLLSRGITGSLGMVMGQALTQMRNEGFADDIPRIGREIRNLGFFLQEESRLRTAFSGGASLLLQQQFRGVGGAFADARQQDMVMGIHSGLQRPPNEFWRAMQMEGIISQDPSLGFDPVGLTKARSRMQQGMFGQGVLEGSLEQIRQMTTDNMLRQVLLVNRFQSLLPYFDSEELKRLVSDEQRGAFALGSESQVKERLASMGLSNKAGAEELNRQARRGSVDDILQEAVKIRTQMQVTGNSISEQAIPLLKAMAGELANMTELMNKILR